ncbi:hypothetical protein SAMN04487910_2742 [Aquimarina amphilecti]|uniref:Uncharacterized protein n=1 Tax=Aquimarina amphilecti TaxID=1038014 RepID=A0A1H7R1A6_AQUAM|nr:hypothetical protein SAMN04487910_2742 [Aquimarina amphilecti]
MDGIYLKQHKKGANILYSSFAPFGKQTQHTRDVASNLRNIEKLNNHSYYILLSVL